MATVQPGQSKCQAHIEERLRRTEFRIGGVHGLLSCRIQLRQFQQFQVCNKLTPSGPAPVEMGLATSSDKAFLFLLFCSFSFVLSAALAAERTKEKEGVIAGEFT